VGDHRQERDALIEAARCGEVREPDQARPARVIEYQVPDRDGNGKNEPVLWSPSSPAGGSPRLSNWRGPTTGSGDTKPGTPS
jgi:hypothetical protein